jgi:hypothetical protein
LPSATALLIDLEGGGGLDAEQLDAEDVVVILSGLSESRCLGERQPRSQSVGPRRGRLLRRPSADIDVPGSGDVERR